MSLGADDDRALGRNARRAQRSSVCRRREREPVSATYCFGRSSPQISRVRGRRRMPSPPARTTPQSCPNDELRRAEGSRSNAGPETSDAARLVMPEENATLVPRMRREAVTRGLSPIEGRHGSVGISRSVAGDNMSPGRHADGAGPSIAPTVQGDGGGSAASRRSDAGSLGALRADLPLAVMGDAVGRAAADPSPADPASRPPIGGGRHDLRRHGPCTCSFSCDATVHRPTPCRSPASPSGPEPRRSLAAGSSSDQGPRHTSAWWAATCRLPAPRHSSGRAGPGPLPGERRAGAAGPAPSRAACSSRPGSGATSRALPGSTVSSWSSPLATRPSFDREGEACRRTLRNSSALRTVRRRRTARLARFWKSAGSKARATGILGPALCRRSATAREIDEK